MCTACAKRSRRGSSSTCSATTPTTTPITGSSSRPEDDEEFPRRRTAVALAKFMALHPHNIAQKTEVIIEHFRNHVRFRLGGRAKAMVVPPRVSTRCATCRAFERYIREQDYTDVHPLVAFSGTVHDPDTGDEYTEPRMNIDRVTQTPIPETALPARFDTPDYQILLVANKYQTGFNQPLLQACMWTNASTASKPFRHSPA